jgi:hypothetical protein
MAILSKLKAKAMHVYAQFRSGSVPPTSNSRVNNVDDDNCRDELAIFGGQTRFLVSKLLTTKSPNWDPAPTNSTNVLSDTLSPVTKSEEDVKEPPKVLESKMEDVHPSLMEYMAFFPPSAFAPGFNMYPDFQVQQPTIDLSIMSEVSALPQSTTGAELADYSYPQLSPPRQPQQQQYMSMTCMDPAAIPDTFSYGPSSTPSFDAFRDSQPYSMSTPTSASTPETPGSGDLTDLGLMMNGDGGMDEQWMSFMRDSGILDRTAGVAA